MLAVGCKKTFHFIAHRVFRTAYFISPLGNWKGSLSIRTVFACVPYRKDERDCARNCLQSLITPTANAHTHRHRALELITVSPTPQSAGCFYYQAERPVAFFVVSASEGRMSAPERCLEFCGWFPLLRLLLLNIKRHILFACAGAGKQHRTVTRSAPRPTSFLWPTFCQRHPNGCCTNIYRRGLHFTFHLVKGGTLGNLYYWKLFH